MSFTVSVIFSRIDLSLPMSPSRDWLSRANRGGGGWFPSLRQLKPLEPMQLFLDSSLEVLACARARTGADPAPLLHQQFPVFAVGFDIERGDDVLARQHRQREIAEHPLLLRDIRLKAMVVIEE